MLYPFYHEHQWRGPAYVWSSINTDEKPPNGCEPVCICRICGAQRAASYAAKEKP